MLGRNLPQFPVCINPGLQTRADLIDRQPEIAASRRGMTAMAWMFLNKSGPAGPPAGTAAPASDPLAGFAKGAEGRQPGRSVLDEALQIASDIRASSDPGAEARRLGALVKDYPGSESLQVAAVRALEYVADRQTALAAWEGVAARFPQSHEA